jgi:hypothetical protein
MDMHQRILGILTWWMLNAGDCIPKHGMPPCRRRSPPSLVEGGWEKTESAREDGPSSVMALLPLGYRRGCHQPLVTVFSCPCRRLRTTSQRSTFPLYAHEGHEVVRGM